VIIARMAAEPARRHTRRHAADAAGIAAAAAILRAGGLVAFPTETVYGLGAHALDATAARGIFEAKGRPADDPLIVHLASAERVHDVAHLDPRAVALARRFWPGPLTLVLPKREHVPAIVTAGLATVAVRVPSHPVARALLDVADLPIAAPSANLFGRPSPTRAEHVLADLDGRIDAVLDGGPTDVGVESTIVDLSGAQPRLLRPGGLAAEAIEAELGVRLAWSSQPVEGPQPAPGMLSAHYAPRTPLTLIVGPAEAARARLAAEVAAAVGRGQRVGVLALEGERDAFQANGSPLRVEVETLGAWDDPDRSARRLFDGLRALDVRGLDAIYVRELADPTVGLGRALADRLRRAAHRVIDTSVLDTEN
jgi:L-threonylcarbamoyladenylate synthase